MSEHTVSDKPVDRHTASESKRGSATRLPTMRPLDGEYRLSPEKRAALCAKAGHPLLYLNLTVSAKVNRDIFQCHCGAANQAPEALRQLARDKTKARKERLAPAAVRSLDLPQESTTGAQGGKL